LAEETGLCATLRAPFDLPRGVSDFDAFLNAGDFALCVVLHAFKCGDALDALAEVRSRSTLGSTLTSDVKVVLVLGGTDVNVDAREAPERAATLARRAAAADVVVAFSPSMVAAAPSGALPPTTVIVPQGVRLPSRETLRPSVSETTTNTGNANTEDVKEEAEETLVPSLHDALGVATSTRVFLLPAGLRPVKDVLWAADAVEERVKGLASSSKKTVSSCSSPAFVLAVLGPSLDAPYASLVAQKARASASSSGARAFTQMPPVAREIALEYMRAAAGVLNTSLSEGQSGALLEAAALGTPVLARDVPGNRALLDMLEEAALGADPGGPEFERDSNAFRDDCFDDDSSPLVAAYAHPCGFLFASPETLAEAMSLLAEDSDAGSAVRRAAGRAADRARRGAEELARREREGWRGVAAGLFAFEK
jgi:hypothetical protein